MFGGLYRKSVQLARHGHAALASTGQTIRFMLGDKAPAMGELSRTSGDLNEDIPFAINVTKAGFLQGQHAKMKIYLNGPSEGLTFPGRT